MISLIETYARSAGLKIGQPWLKQHFFPLPFTKYVTLSAGSGQAAKNYDHFQIIVDLLNPILSPLDIHIVQLGDKDTPLFTGTYDLRTKTNIAQSTYLFKNALAHFGNDSWGAHACGILGTPLCCLYGTTDKDSHGPYWRNGPTILLESHRSGRKPTYGAEGQPKSVNTIPPESVAEAVLKLLCVSHPPFNQTALIGQFYPHTIFDYVPNGPLPTNISHDIPITARLDIEFNEANLLSVLQSGRKVTIVTSKPLNLNMLVAFRANILSYNHEIDDSCPLDYPTKVKAIISNSVFFSRAREEDVLSRLRFRYFDVCTIEQVTWPRREDVLREMASYLNKPLDKLPQLDTMWYKTNKFIMSKGKIYLSYYHEAHDMPVSDFGTRAAQVIDDDLFIRDYQHYLLYVPAITTTG